MRRVALTVNGERHEAEVEPRQLLVYFFGRHLAKVLVRRALEEAFG